MFGALTSWLRPSSKNRRKPRQLPAQLRHLQPGEYAGIAIYRPRDRRDLKPELYDAIGKPFHLLYTGIAAPDEAFAGQMLFQERQAAALRSWLPEQDLEFVQVAPSTAIAPAAAYARRPVARAS